MKKKYLLIVLIIVFIALCCIRISIMYSKNNNNTISFRGSKETYNAYTWAEFSKNKTISNDTGIEKHLKNQSDVEAYLTQTGNDLSGDKIWLDNDENIRFPTGTYTIKNRTDFYITSASGNIDFNNSNFVIGDSGIIYTTVLGNQHNRYYENLTVYGNTKYEIGDTGNGSYIAGSDITLLGKGYYLQAIKASNFNFKNLEYNASQMAGLHIFDIMACNNFTFDNITNRGTLDNWTQEQVNYVYGKDNHRVYAEMIQIDISATTALGLSSFLSEDFTNNYWSSVVLDDRIPTTNTTLSNIRSTSYYGPRGQNIIDNSGTKSTYPYASSIGSHAIGNIPYTNININNAYFENVVHADNERNKRQAPIHFMTLSIDSINQINNTGATGNDLINIIVNDSVWQNTLITLSNNKYINCSNYFYDPDNPGEKTQTSSSMAAFDKDVKTVNKIDLVLEDGTVLKTYNSYSPEEAVYDNKYIYVSSNYENGTLTRTYRNPVNSIIENNTYLDEEGNTLTDISGYIESKKTTDNQSKEKLVNGDTIIVQYNTITYKKAPHVLTLLNVPDTSSYSTIVDILIGIVFISIGITLVLLTKNKEEEQI